MKKDFLINRMTTEEIQSVLATLRIIEEERYRTRNCYFWGGLGNSATRRSYEAKHSIPEVKWTEGGGKYACAFAVTCRCRYTRAETLCEKNGRPTNWTSIKSSISRLKKIVEARNAESQNPTDQ